MTNPPTERGAIQCCKCNVFFNVYRAEGIFSMKHLSFFCNTCYSELFPDEQSTKEANNMNLQISSGSQEPISNP